MDDERAKEIAKGALRIDWWDTESAARRVAEYAADLAPTDAQIMAHPHVQALVEALKCAVQDFYEMANKIDDEDYVGTPDGCNATVYGHFKKYRKMHVDYCIKAADRALAALEDKS